MENSFMFGIFDKIIPLSLAIFSMLIPLQDLPRLNIGPFQLRLGLIGIPFIFPFILKNMNSALVKKIQNNKKILFLFLSLTLFVVVQFLFNFLFFKSIRGIGFCVWFCLNLCYLFAAIQFDSKYLLRGAIIGQTFVAIHIILTHFFPDVIPYPVIHRDFRYYMEGDFSYLRAFSFMGEPSYVPLMWCPLLIILLNKIEKKFDTRYSTLLYLFIIAAGLVYSRLMIIGLIIVCLHGLILLRKDKKVFVQVLAVPLLLSFSLSFIRFSEFYGFKTFEPPEKLVKVIRRYRGPSSLIPFKGLVHGSETDRLRALFNGVEVFRNHPWFGVGLGNSLEIIKKETTREDDEFVQGPHNIILELLVETGIFGTFWLVFTFIFCLYSGAVSFAIYMPFLSVCLLMQFAQNINMPAFWIFLGILMRHIYQQHPKEANLNILS